MNLPMSDDSLGGVSKRFFFLKRVVAWRPFGKLFSSFESLKLSERIRHVEKAYRNLYAWSLIVSRVHIIVLFLTSLVCPLFWELGWLFWLLHVVFCILVCASYVASQWYFSTSLSRLTKVSQDLMRYVEDNVDT